MTAETILPATTQGTPEKRELALLKAVGFDKLAPEMRELALAIADRYDLDPMLRHLVLIDGKPFITRDGLLWVAHRSKQFDGIKVTRPVKDEKFWRAEATVWRKDMTHPIEFFGRYPVGAKNDEEMCVKVAESMALRRAFNVAAPTVEERWASDDAEVVAASRPAPGSSLAEIARSKAAAVSDAPQAEEGVFVDADPTPEPVADPEPSVVATGCGAVAEDGLMAGSVCILKPDHAGAHKAEDGSWPR